MRITLGEANDIIGEAIAHAGTIGIQISVAVCDEGGRLKAFGRMDGARWASLHGAQGKAVAAAAFQRSGREMEERAETLIIRGIVSAEGGNMIPSEGAVPIWRNGELIGACGAGGGTAEQDEECARKAVEKTIK